MYKYELMSLEKSTQVTSSDTRYSTGTAPLFKANMQLKLLALAGVVASAVAAPQIDLRARTTTPPPGWTIKKFSRSESVRFCLGIRCLVWE